MSVSKLREWYSSAYLASAGENVLCSADVSSQLKYSLTFSLMDSAIFEEDVMDLNISNSASIGLV